MNFREWLLLERGATTAKVGNYPISYLGIYPPSYRMASAADVLYFMSIDDRFYLGKEGAPNSITKIPGKPSHKKPTSGEGPPWKISHI